MEDKNFSSSHGKTKKAIFQGADYQWKNSKNSCGPAGSLLSVKCFFSSERILEFLENVDVFLRFEMIDYRYDKAIRDKTGNDLKCF